MKKKLNITISGTPATGKTSIAHFIEQELSRRYDFTVKVDDPDYPGKRDFVNPLKLIRLSEKVNIEIVTHQVGPSPKLAANQRVKAREAIEAIREFRLQVSGYGAGSESNLPAFDGALETLQNLLVK